MFEILGTARHMREDCILFFKTFLNHYWTIFVCVCVGGGRYFAWRPSALRLLYTTATEID